MNYSKQRELILETLTQNVVHPSADYIYNILKKTYPNISLATVYRNLNKLAELGVIKKIEGLEASDHFDHNTFEHYHLICIECGRIFDVPADIAPDICEKLEEKTGFKVIKHEITFRGVCPECQSKCEKNTIE
ncbi:MAG: Fur family transcriptional regulator [Candidatus Gastranaerophilales bacterium]|nr:Fur family transcriptional regulator [Candidatus Gastranaerophilales bacterium]